MIECIYNIAKNVSILYEFWAELLLLIMHFWIEDTIASALFTKRFQLFISSIYYC